MHALRRWAEWLKPKEVHELEVLVDNEDWPAAQAKLNELKDILGPNDDDVVRLNAFMELSIYFSKEGKEKMSTETKLEETKTKGMSKDAWAHNEWLRLYIEEPESFTAEFRSITEFLSETGNGHAPSYGENCAAYLAELVARAPDSEEERLKSFEGYSPDWD